MTTANNITFTVFTKPWRMPLPELAHFVRAVGFDGVELPVRPGYPVTPENVGTALPEAVKIFADQGLTIGSVAGGTDDATLAACGACGVPIVRICVAIPAEQHYLTAIAGVAAGMGGIAAVAGTVWGGARRAESLWPLHCQCNATTPCHWAIRSPPCLRRLGCRA